MAKLSSYPRLASGHAMPMVPVIENGQNWNMDAADLRGAVSPLDFGAIGDGASHKASTRYASLAALQAVYPFATSLDQELDWLALQAALNHGGPVTSPALHYKLCNSAPASHKHLVIVAGKSWVNLHGSSLDATQMVARTNPTHYLTDPNFASGTAWQNAWTYDAGQLTNTVLSGGAAVYTDPAAHAANFCQFGQQVTLGPGTYRAYATVTTTKGASYDHGNDQPPYGAIRFFASSPGVGSDMAGGRIASLVGLGPVAFGGTVTQTVEFIFTLTSTQTGWFTFSGGGYANFTVTEMDVVQYFPNCAILCTRDGAELHYPIYQPFSGFILSGPYYGGPYTFGTPSTSLDGLTGVKWESYSNIDGNLVAIRDCMVQSFDIGLYLGDGAYLMPFENVQVLNCGRGTHYPPGRVNAGEVFRFVHGAIAGCRIAISNPGGAEFKLWCTAIDYNVQALVDNTGYVEWHGIHCEMVGQATAGKPLIHCKGAGTLSWFGGTFLGAGGPMTGEEPPIKLEDNNSVVQLYGTELYNLASTDTVCSGSGLLLAPGGWRNRGNPNVGANMLSRAAAMDALAGAGRFEPVTGVFTGGDAVGIDLPGGIYCATATMTNRWTGPNFTATPSTAKHHSGTRSLKLTKSGIGAGADNYQWVIPIALRPGQHVWGEFWWLAPDAVGSGTAPLYVRYFWGRQIGVDTLGRPIWAKANFFKGEVDINLPLAGSPDWTKYAFKSTYENPVSDDTSLGGFAGAPPWATHFAVLIDTVSLPAMSIYFDDLVVNVL